MKKSILILALVLALSFAFSVSSLAYYDNIADLSDDYSTLYINGDSYSRANTDCVNLDVYAEGVIFTSGFGSEGNYTTHYIENIKIELTDSQKSELTKAYVRTMGEAQLFAIAELYYEDGTTIWYSYVRDDVKDDFNEIKNSDTNEYVIKFETYSDEGDILKKVSPEMLLTGNKVEITFFEYQEFGVFEYSNKFDYSVFKGCVYANTEKDLYYYLDFDETGITDPYELYDLYDYNGITRIYAHKITDEETITIIKEGLQEYYDSDYGYIYNEEFTEPVAKMFFILVFAIFPLAIAVTTLVLATKSKKGLYKKLLFATSGLSLASLAVFVYIAFTLFNK